MINRVCVRNHYFTALVCAITIIMLAACSANNCFFDDSPPSAKHIPVYPNAASIREEAVGNVHRTVFTTADGGTNVLDYYKSILVPEGWAMYPVPSQSTPAVSNIQNMEDAVFSWRSNDNSYGYKFLVRISLRVSDGITVTTEMGLDPGR
jgi:hypothetical protein